MQNALKSDIPDSLVGLVSRLIGMMELWEKRGSFWVVAGNLGDGSCISSAWFFRCLQKQGFSSCCLVGWLSLTGREILDRRMFVVLCPDLGRVASGSWIIVTAINFQFRFQKGWFFLFSTRNLFPVLYTLVIWMQIKWPNKSLNLHDIGSSSNADRKSLNTLSSHKLQVKFWIPTGHNFQMQVGGPDTPDI